MTESEPKPGDSEKLPIRILKWAGGHIDEVLKAILGATVTFGTLAAAWDWIIHRGASITYRILTNVVPVWCVLLLLTTICPLCYHGILRLRARRRDQRSHITWHHSQSMLWKCRREGSRIAELTPFCPNPNCERSLGSSPSPGTGFNSERLEATRYACPNRACGFHVRQYGSPGAIAAKARREIEESQPPSEPFRLRVW